MTGKIHAEWSISGEGGPIDASNITIDTPHGQFQIGIDRSGNTYLSVEGLGETALDIRPVSTNRILISADLPFRNS